MYEFILYVLIGVFSMVAISFFSVMLMKEKSRDDAGVNLGKPKDKRGGGR